MSSSDNKDTPCTPQSTSEPKPNHVFTTNGARSDDIVEEAVSWVLLLAEHGKIPINKLDSILHASEKAIYMLLESIEIHDQLVVDAILTYIRCKQEGDHAGYLRSIKTLVTNQESPFCLAKGHSFRLPPPTKTEEVIPGPERERTHTQSRAQASQRANQLIAQYQLKTFDPAVDPHKYLEWKFDILDVCSVEDCYSTRVEIVLTCLTPATRLFLLQNVGTQSSAEPCSSKTMYETLLMKLDSSYANFRAIRHIESSYLTMRVNENETLSSFYTRFQRYSRLYERSKGIILSDSDKIIAFGSGLDNRFAFLGSFIETAPDCCSFSDYAQRLIYLTSKIPESSPAVDLNAVETRGMKRSRTEEGPHQNSSKRGFGCYRCQQGNHRAVDCSNPVKDPTSRCPRCGSRKHVLSKCIAKLTRNCRRCNGQHFESICPAPLTKRTANAAPIEADNFDKLKEALSLATINCDCDCGSMFSDIVDAEAPMLSLKFSEKGSEHRGLFDTGAAANFISTEKIIELHKSKDIQPEMVVKLEPPMKIRFGNGSTFDSNMALKTTVYTRGEYFDATFVICPTLTPSLIVGRPLLKRMNVLNLCVASVPFDDNINTKTIENDLNVKLNSAIDLNSISRVDEDTTIKPNTPWIEVTPYGNKFRLMARFRLFEESMMEPLREPIRPRSATSERIILSRLIQMAEDDSLYECSLEEVPVVIPIVLIDKSPQKHRSFPDPEVHQRYRITFDLRGYNRLTLAVSDSGQFALIPRSLNSIEDDDKRRTVVDQFQRSSFEILRKMPVEKCMFFSKIDIANAYNSVFLPESMQHIGTEVYDAEKGQYRYFRCRTLSQGWRYSPTFFRMCANLLVNKCKKEFEDKYDGTHIDYFQDDIILCSANKEELTAATEVAIRILEDHSLTVRRNKVVIAADEIVFCGYLIREGKCRPNPTRRKLDTELSEKLWEELVRSHPHNRAGVINWTRSFAGMCQYLYGFLGPKQLISLQNLYRYCSEGDITNIESYRETFDSLVTFVSGGLPFMCLGSFNENDIICTIIISDANQDSWSSIILKLIRSNVPHNDEFDELRTVIATELKTDCSCSIIIPVRICGSRFGSTTRKQSSTYRERVAVLSTLEEAKSLLEGEVVVVTDNRNCRLQWHDVETLGARLSTLWSLYCQTVSCTIWLPRESYPSLADLVARLLAVDKGVLETDMSTQVQLNSAHAESVESPSLQSDIINAYAVDDTEYFDLKMRDIINFKLVQNGSRQGNLNVDEKVKKAANHFELDAHNVLWYKSAKRVRLYIPNCRSSFITHGDKGVRGALLLRAHCAADIHLGNFRTIHNMRDYWWPNIGRDIIEFVRSCWDCTITKTRWISTHHDNSIESTTKDFTRPFQGWFIDHCGPIEVSSGPRYVLVCVCGFSHFCYAVPVESVDARTTAFELFKMFCIFGIPARVHSDRGSAFTSELDSELADLLKIDRRLSPVAFPRANGLCERAVGTIKSLVSTMPGSNISTMIPLACLVQNSMPFSRIALEMTPFEASFGFRPRSINDIYFSSFGTQAASQPFSAELQYYMRKAYHFYAEEVSQTTVNRSALLTNASLMFQPGDMVIAIRGRKGTDGPYILLNQIASNIWRMFRLEDGLTVSIAEFPVSLLKKYSPCDLIKGLPCEPPIPDNDPSKLKRHDFVIAKNSDDGPISVGLFQVLTTDPNAQNITAKIWRPNQLLEFFQTEALTTIPWRNILLSRFKLSSRMIPEPIQKAVFSLLGGRL